MTDRTSNERTLAGWVQSIADIDARYKLGHWDAVTAMGRIGDVLRSASDYVDAAKRGPVETSPVQFGNGLGARVGKKFSFSFPTEQEAEQAFRKAAELFGLETSQPHRNPLKRCPGCGCMPGACECSPENGQAPLVGGCRTCLRPFEDCECGCTCPLHGFSDTKCPVHGSQSTRQVPRSWTCAVCKFEWTSPVREPCPQCHPQ